MSLKVLKQGPFFLEGGFMLKDLEKYVDELNSIYCYKSKNHLVIREMGCHYQVCLTGKNAKEGLKTRYFGITNGFAEPIVTLRCLKECEKYGWLRSVINRYDRRI